MPHGLLDVQMDHRRAEQNPLCDREIPDQRARLGGRRQSRAGHGAPEAREDAEDDRKEQHPANELATILPRSRCGDAKERDVLRHRVACHDATLLRSAPAYKARMTSSSGASSIARSRTAPC